MKLKLLNNTKENLKNIFGEKHQKNIGHLFVFYLFVLVLLKGGAFQISWLWALAIGWFFAAGLWFYHKYANIYYWLIQPIVIVFAGFFITGIRFDFIAYPLFSLAWLFLNSRNICNNPKWSSGINLESFAGLALYLPGLLSIAVFGDFNSRFNYSDLLVWLSFGLPWLPIAFLYLKPLWKTLENRPKYLRYIFPPRLKLFIVTNLFCLGWVFFMIPFMVYHTRENGNVSEFNQLLFGIDENGHKGPNWFGGLVCIGEDAEHYYVLYSHYHGEGVQSYMKEEVHDSLPLLKTVMQKELPEPKTFLYQIVNNTYYNKTFEKIEGEDFIRSSFNARLEFFQENRPSAYGVMYKGVMRMDWYIKWYNRFWWAVVLELVFIPVFIIYVLWAVFYGYRKKLFPLLIGLVPFLLFLPYWFGYGKGWYYHPWGGIFYNVMLIPFYDIRPICSFDYWFLDFCHYPLDSLSRSLRCWRLHEGVIRISITSIVLIGVIIGYLANMAKTLWYDNKESAPVE